MKEPEVIQTFSANNIRALPPEKLQQLVICLRDAGDILFTPPRFLKAVIAAEQMGLQKRI